MTAARIVTADALDFLRRLPPQSVDLVFASPPYEDARTYGINFKLKGQAWVDWMVEVFAAAQRACRGLVAFVVEGKTRNFRWSAVPALLMADLHRAGFQLRKPPAFHRVGIPGSGGPDWLRNDYEFIVCTSPGRLPWSDNTAMGHVPKRAPGGAMSNRNAHGVRKNARDYKRAGRGRRVVRGKKYGDTATSDSYDPPDFANPGNVLTYKVGGGLMGHPSAHENEAPFPEGLPEFFVRSFCPPGGMVVDCFVGSGTTAAVATRWRRNFMGCDIRPDQVKIARNRVAEETPVAILLEKETA